MTPIKWNGSSWVKPTGSDKEWYDYTGKKWANAKTSDGVCGYGYQGMHII